MIGQATNLPRRTNRLTAPCLRARSRLLCRSSSNRVLVLTKTYNTTGEAMDGISSDIQKFYSSKYPAVYAGQRQTIQAAIADLQHIYESTIFPYMKVDWRTHPNNIGHLYSPSCFRCHDGQHIGADGRVIPKTCDTCHTVLAEVQRGVPLISHEQVFRSSIRSTSATGCW